MTIVENSIVELSRREGISTSMYYGWFKEFLEAEKLRLAGDTTRAATSDAPCRHHSGTS